MRDIQTFRHAYPGGDRTRNIFRLPRIWVLISGWGDWKLRGLKGIELQTRWDVFNVVNHQDGLGAIDTSSNRIWNRPRDPRCGEMTCSITGHTSFQIQGQPRFMQTEPRYSF